MMRRHEGGKPDYVLALTVFLLCLFGIVMIFSASAVTSQEYFNNSYYYAYHQIISLVVGLVLMIIAYLVDYRFWKKIALPLFLGSLLLLIAVFFPGIGKAYGGAHRWIGLGSHIIQPSEIVKLTFLIYLAFWLEKKGEGVKNFMTGFIPFLFLVAVLGFLIIIEPDMGTLMVIVITSVVVFYIAGARYSHLGLALASAVVLVAALIKAAPYRMSRFTVFLNPGSQTQGAAYHINQALLGIGSGGLWGLGFGQSKQKYFYLPQAHTDSIFAIIGEELGFVRTILVIGAYVFFALRGFRIAKNAPDNFAKFLAVGITTWIVIQAFINIGSMLSVMPMTGIPLPFISFGGSSLMFSLFGIGILLNISKFSRNMEKTI
ncbi:MAG: putative lipid II flippase FtsW [Patescibacteria group bacterium]|jgi:cell division protein FtsW